MTTSDFSFKLLLIGDSSVGKSCILTRLVEDQFMKVAPATIGISITEKTVDIEGRRVTIKLMDTAGQERFRAIVRGFYHNAYAACIVYSIDDPSSFSTVEEWLNDIKANSPPDLLIYLVGNKLDLEELRQVTTSQGISFTHTHGLQSFFEVSARTGQNIVPAFRQIALDAYRKSRTERIPERSATIYSAKLDASQKRGKNQCCQG